MAEAPATGSLPRPMTGRAASTPLPVTSRSRAPVPSFIPEPRTRARPRGDDGRGGGGREVVGTKNVLAAAPSSAAAVEAAAGSRAWRASGKKLSSSRSKSKSSSPAERSAQVAAASPGPAAAPPTAASGISGPAADESLPSSHERNSSSRVEGSAWAAKAVTGPPAAESAHGTASTAAEQAPEVEPPTPRSAASPLAMAPAAASRAEQCRARFAHRRTRPILSISLPCRPEPANAVAREWNGKPDRGTSCMCSARASAMAMTRPATATGTRTKAQSPASHNGCRQAFASASWSFNRRKATALASTCASLAACLLLLRKVDLEGPAVPPGPPAASAAAAPVAIRKHASRPASTGAHAGPEPKWLRT